MREPPGESDDAVGVSFASAVQILGQVMQTLYNPKTGRPIRFITAIMRNARTGDADVIFGNRQFASGRWGALIDFEHLVFTISHLEDGYNWPLVLPIQWTCPVPVRSPEAVVPLPESSSSTDAAQQSASTSEGEGGDVSSPSKISAVRFAEQANPESSQSVQLPVTPHPKVTPAEAREELLRQQFEPRSTPCTSTRCSHTSRNRQETAGFFLTQ